MNWIHKVLRAAHDKRFLVEIYCGTQIISAGFVEVMDDETAIIRSAEWIGNDKTVVLICSVTSLIPYPGIVDSHDGEDRNQTRRD